MVLEMPAELAKMGSMLHPSKFEVLTKRKDITQKRIDAGVELESQEVIETITRDYWATD